MEDATESHWMPLTMSVSRQPWAHLEAAKTRDDAVRAAADIASEAVGLLVGQLANRVLDRPAFASPEWQREAELDKADPERGQARRREWHLTKLHICRAARLDPTGDAINARRAGASWVEIGAACGITRQAAHDRWARYIQP